MMVKFGLSVSTEIDEKIFKEYIETLQPFVFSAEPSGMHLYRLLHSVFQGKPISIVETGCLRDTEPSAAFSDGWSTLYLAKYAHESKSSFISIEMEAANIEKCGTFLKDFGLFRDVLFTCEQSPEALEEDFPADFYLLDSCDGLEHGLAEFVAALKHKPKIIVMDDLDTKARKAVEFADEVGIQHQQIDRYTVFDLRNHVR